MVGRRWRKRLKEKENEEKESGDKKIGGGILRWCVGNGGIGLEKEVEEDG